jgi:hypothetical protein
MDIREYAYKKYDKLWMYEFISEGPKGKIRKIVEFIPFNYYGRICFNLFLGDWNEEINSADELIISNNQDSLKVLVTVAKIVLEFTNSMPGAIVHIKGNSPSRTRLYQIGITKYWIDISALFTVVGYYNNKWQFFLKNVNYDAFMVYRKKSYIYNRK